MARTMTTDIECSTDIDAPMRGHHPQYFVKLSTDGLGQAAADFLCLVCALAFGECVRPAFEM